MQLAVYPAGINARYERHRDAYPDDGYESEEYDDEGDCGGEEEIDDRHTNGLGRQELEKFGRDGTRSDDRDHFQEGEERLETGGASGGGAEIGTTSCGSGDIGGSVSYRRVTAICYLRGNGTPWEASDGGALRLYPPARASDGEDTSGRVSTNDARTKVIFKNFDVPVNANNEGSDIDDTNPQGQAEREQENLDSGVKAPVRSTPEGVHADTDGEALNRDEGRESSRDYKVGDGVEFLDVAPVAGRAVVFLSGAVEHEVLQVTGPLPRAALTTWFH